MARRAGGRALIGRRAARQQALDREPALHGTAPDEAAPDEAAPDEAAPDEAAPDETAPDEAAPEPAARSGGAPWSVVALAVALAVAALMVAGSLLVTRPADRSAEDQIRAEALEAARAAAVSLTTYDHRTLDEDFARVSGQSTEQFRTEYAETSDQLRPALEQAQAVATSEVPAVGIESLSLDPVEVVLVVAVDQTITTAGAPPRTEFNRIRMTLVRTEQAWLIGDVERL